VPSVRFAPEAVLRAERLLRGEVSTWRRVASRGWSVNEHWLVTLTAGARS
jgi:hypothetical protein